MTQDIPQRLDDLEIKTTFQEQLIADLNDELVQHGARISQLEQQINRLIEHIKGIQDKPTSADEKPPHY